MILWFSGTGNSRHAAETVALITGDRNTALMADRNIPAIEREAAADTTGRVVWVFPVYSWGVPPIVEDFISRLPSDIFEGRKHFMVATCGDDIGLTDRQWRKLMHRKGWQTEGCWSVQMPNTFVTMKGFDVDPVQTAETKLTLAEDRIKHIAERILQNGDETDVVRGKFARVKSSIIRPWFKRFAIGGKKPFRATDACTGCSNCAKTCPTCNITIVGNRPQWGNNCALCLGCYHHCPRKAIEYGNKTVHKGQYTFDSFTKKHW